MDIEPDHVRALVRALGGAAIYGPVQFGATALSVHTPTQAQHRALAIKIGYALPWPAVPR